MTCMILIAGGPVPNRSNDVTCLISLDMSCALFFFHKMISQASEIKVSIHILITILEGLLPVSVPDGTLATCLFYKDLEKNTTFLT